MKISFDIDCTPDELPRDQQRGQCSDETEDRDGDDLRSYGPVRGGSDGVEVNSEKGQPGRNQCRYLGGDLVRVPSSADEL